MCVFNSINSTSGCHRWMRAINATGEYIIRGGLAHCHDYWQSYSFGGLNETVKTRKQIPGNLLPRLKIAPVLKRRNQSILICRFNELKPVAGSHTSSLASRIL